MGKPKGKSRGLAVLRAQRPAAAEHLLKFFAESARHLEPKTRFLISIVTKVINFSPRGLEQYVGRALDEGASADEILDAILCSYPCAGLTRVVDAIDVLLDMDRPELAHLGAAEQTTPAPSPTEATPDDESAREWIEVAQSDDLPEDGGLKVKAGRHILAVFKTSRGLFALDNLCPHMKGGTLATGVVIEDAVTCPFHGWTFDLESGECRTMAGISASRYDVRERDGIVEVRV